MDVSATTVVAETSITIFSQCQLFNSFLPVFNMPGYTPNIFNVRLESPLLLADFIRQTLLKLLVADLSLLRFKLGNS